MAPFLLVPSHPEDCMIAFPLSPAHCRSTIWKHSQQDHPQGAYCICPRSGHRLVSGGEVHAQPRSCLKVGGGCECSRTWESEMTPSALSAGLPPVFSPLLWLLRQGETDRESWLPAALGLFPGGDGGVCLQLYHPLKKVCLFSSSKSMPKCCG